METRKPYTVMNLWDDVEKYYQDFISHNQVQPSSKADKEAYEHTSDVVARMIQLGREAQRINFYWHPLLKAQKGMEVKNLFETNFGSEKIPPIKGEKSLAFIKEVIIPLEDKSSEIEHEWWMVMLCNLVGIDLVAETKLGKEMADKLREKVAAEEKQIDEKESDVSLLSKWGSFAEVPEKRETEEVQEKRSSLSFG